MEDVSRCETSGLRTNVLLDLARQGGEAAREVLFRRHRAAVERMARRLYPAGTRSPAFDVEDLVQDTLATAWEKLHEYRGESRFLLWLVQILKHRFVSRQRHETRDKRDVARARRLESADDWASPRETSPSARMRAREEEERIENRMGRLGEQDREILVLRYECGLTHDEIASELNVPNEIARKRLSRARARLGVLLGE